MNDLSQSEIDLDAMMREIRAEVARRKAVGGAGMPGPAGSAPSTDFTNAPTAAAAAPLLVLSRLPDPASHFETKDRYTLADFLQFYDEAFVRNAYLGILRRTPDGAGLAGFLEALCEGRLSKTEILGRLRFSREGRAVGVAVKGLLFAFTLRTLRRAPVVGRVLGIIQYLMRLPDIVRNHERLEAVVFHRELQLHRHINTVESQIEVAVGTLTQNADVIGTRVAQTLARLDSHDQELRRIAQTLARLDSHDQELRRIAQTLARLDSHDQELRRIAQTLARLDSHDQELRRIAQTLARLDSHDQELRRIAQTLARLDSHDQELRRIAQTLARLDSHDQELRRIASVLTGLEIGFREQWRNIAHLLRSSASKSVVDDTPSDSRETAFAAFYVAFQNRFRGTTEDIRSRLAVYLPVVKAAGIGSSEAPFVDLGSGRGEWLQLLKGQDLTARGVDTNSVMVDVCREQKLEVIEADAVHYLKAQPPGSVGGITAFHLIEHLSFADLLALFDESLRVLRPGGLLIFETPNPENLVVGACNFHLDPTHQRPLPPTMLSFVAEARGFERVETRRLHPSSAPTGADGSPVLLEIVESLLYGAQDYAIIAYKPGGTVARLAEAHEGSEAP